MQPLPNFIKPLHLVWFLFVLISLPVFSQFGGRSEHLFDDEWLFYRGEAEGAEKLDYRDNDWRMINLPHDWSIEDLPAIDKSQRVVLNIVRDTWRFMPGDKMSWRETDFQDGMWKEVNLPLNWGVHSGYTDEDAYGWYRKSVDISKDYKGVDVYLNLGKIADVDQAYFNGEIIGNSGAFPPSYHSAAHLTRQYKVPDRLINYGKENKLAIRVYCKKDKGGIYSKGEPQIVSGPYDSHADNGRNSGFTRNGIGWYRKTFKVPENYRAKKVQFLFEGIYQNASIWINEKEVGTQVNGYTSFVIDATPHLNYGGKNTIAIKVDNSGHTSRWYSGSGIYRHVWMQVTNPMHIDHNGIYIRTESLDEEMGAALNLKARIKSDRKDTINVRFRTEIMGPDKQQVVFDVREERILGGRETTIRQNFLIGKPEIWSPDSPALYTAVSTINIDGVFIDRVETPFGIRTIKVDPLNGFQLNGKPMLLKGGNIHSDLGILGARSFDDAETRKVKQLLNHGFNAVRCVHNPPAPAFLDACDKLGLLVINEAFDTWSKPKVVDDYSVYFKDWWQKDLKGMIERDANHPSLIMWSIGNDVEERFSMEGHQRATEMVAFVRQLDLGRPITAAVSADAKNVWESVDTFFNALDVAGYNYEYARYKTDHKRDSNRVMIGLESYPSEIKESWEQTQALPYVIGDFTWSAMDYLGEAAKGWYSFENEPEDLFPWTTAFCGDLDLIGEPRPQWYFRKTVWGQQAQTYIMVRPAMSEYKARTRIDWGWREETRSWSWHGHDMVFFEVYVYSNCDRIKLYQNGKVIAERRIEKNDNNTALFYVPYSFGSLRAIGFIGKNPVSQDILRSVGVPSQIALKPDVTSLVADGQSLMFVTVEVQDAKKQHHPMARAPLSFSISGPAEIIAIGNADPQNIESLTDLVHSTFKGKCVAVIRSSNKVGEAVLEVSANGIETKKLVFQLTQAAN